MSKNPVKLPYEALNHKGTKMPPYSQIETDDQALALLGWVLEGFPILPKVNEFYHKCRNNGYSPLQAYTRAVQVFMKV